MRRGEEILFGRDSFAGARKDLESRGTYSVEGYIEVLRVKLGEGDSREREWLQANLR